MGWRDHLQTGNETLVGPWVGGRILRSRERSWAIVGRLPREFGWFRWKLKNRAATVDGPVDRDSSQLDWKVRGYLIGDRILLDLAKIDPDPRKIVEQSEAVFIIDEGLDKFVRITAGRICEDGPLFYEGLDMPLGPEEDVLGAFLDRASSVSHIPNVTPGLDAAFRMESFQRSEAERRRAEAERLRREVEERIRREEHRRQIAETLGTGQGRRAMAAIDFAEAARAALRVGGADFLDHRPSGEPGEMIVRFRLEHRRFECTCNERTLQIIDSGICLTGHESGIRHDDQFTLESLPGVIREAIDLGVLVIFRHAR